jgi:uncharacterized protein (DUF924 family)
MIRLLSPDDVLEFWFGSTSLVATELQGLPYIESRMDIWFGGKDARFDDVQRANEDLMRAVAAGDAEALEWKALDSPETMMAKIVLLDQFPRCIYRGTAEAFMFDELVSATVRDVLDRENGAWVRSDLFSPIHRFFVGVAAQHSENIDMQKRGVLLASHLVCQASTLGSGVERASVKLYFQHLKGYPNEHYDVIEEFGRFPSRNYALGRQSTLREEEWMRGPDCPAWARSQMKK